MTELQERGDKPDKGKVNYCWLDEFPDDLKQKRISFLHNTLPELNITDIKDELKRCSKSEHKPLPGSAEMVVEVSSAYQSAQFWTNSKALIKSTLNGSYACAWSVSSVLVQADVLKATVAGIGELANKVKEAGWAEIKEGGPQPGDLLIMYHSKDSHLSANQEREDRHAVIVAEPNKKGELMGWNNTMRTGGKEVSVKQGEPAFPFKMWDVEPLSAIPYDAFRIYRAPH